MAHPEKFQMRVSPEFLEHIDEWRRGQKDIPPRAEAIRRLVTLGLNHRPMLLAAASALKAMGRLADRDDLTQEERDEVASVLHQLANALRDWGTLMDAIPPAKDGAEGNG
ncbi:MAG TPA: hypothetical protein VD860_17030 [Azospirillum sp.]|nr:hypothetical protein [Azospirillum sp.]